MHITFYRKYRPKSFEEVYGEDNIIRVIKNSLDKNRLSHAYLFTGPRGVGKTTTARLIAKGINCDTNGISSNPCNKCDSCIEIDKNIYFDLIEIDAASNRGINEIRELREKVNYKPVKGIKKIYIIDEVHMLTKEAFNALLKTLEEPPTHVIFVLATTEPDKILDTIISRCQRYDFNPISLEEVRLKIKDIAKKENLEIDEKSIELIYKKSGGSLRDAISNFEKVAIYSLGEKITQIKTEKSLGIIGETFLREFLEIIISENKDKGTLFLDELWAKGIDLEDFFRSFAFLLKELIVNKNETITIEKSIFIIETIFDITSKFRYEEDKRLLAYIILYKVLEKKRHIVEKIYSERIEKVEKIEKESYNNNDLDLKTINYQWKEYLNKLKDVKITFLAFLAGSSLEKFTNGELFIKLSSDSSINKKLLEKNENLKIMRTIFKEQFGSVVTFKFLIDKREIGEVRKGDASNLLKEFFNGEII